MKILRRSIMSSAEARCGRVNASEAGDVSRYVLLERRPGDNKYIVVDTADTVANVKRLAYDWYDSDRSHLPKTSAPSEYWGYDTIKHKAYLPKWFSEDEQTFDYSLPIDGLDDIDASVDVRCSCHGRKKSVKAADTTPDVKQLWDFLIESGWVYDAAEYFDIDSSTDEEAAMRAVPKHELMRWIEKNAYDEFAEYFDIDED